uniref:exodeoxyribonuclease III n=1 Tax=Seriola lalandi dorsalis TaxID=1841481 RepID=A0A3B4WDT5_SERLL
MSVSFVSINVRGLKNIVKRKAIFLFCKEQQANCFFLQETHSGLADETFWKQQWGDETFFSHGTSHSAGVMVLFSKFPGKVIEHKSDTDGHWLILVVEIHDQRYICVCVYGYNNRPKNRVMMESLGSFIKNWEIKYMTDKVVLGGDFNIAPDSWLDRIPHRGQQPEYDDILTNLCISTHTVDYWRITNPMSLKYTWTNSADNNQCSRLDYWLISQTISKDVLKCEISISPLTDHCMIKLALKIIQQPQSSETIWKFNNSLLLNDGFCKQVKILFQSVDKLDMSHMSKWEWFKFKLKHLAIETGKRIAQTRKHKQNELTKKINTLCEKTVLSIEEKAELRILQVQIDDMYREKANGAFIRSRARWLEQGEKNTSYFHGLEKQRQSKRRINRLKKNEDIIDDQKQVKDEIWLFYNNLYKSNFQIDEADSNNKQVTLAYSSVSATTLCFQFACQPNQ